jgi:hypothetical protein
MPRPIINPFTGLPLQQPATELRRRKDGALSAGEEECMQYVHEQWLDTAEDFLEDSKVLAACLDDCYACLEQEDGQETDCTLPAYVCLELPAYVCFEFLRLSIPPSRKTRMLVSKIITTKANKS